MERMEQIYEVFFFVVLYFWIAKTNQTIDSKPVDTAVTQRESVMYTKV